MDKKDFFREATLKISGRLDVENALADLFHFLRQHMPCDILSLHYFNQATRELRFLAKAMIKDGVFTTQPGGTVVMLPEYEAALLMAENAIRKYQPVEVHRPFREPPERRLDIPILEDVFKDLMSMVNLVLHLRIENERIGILLLSAHPPADYTPEHEALLAYIRKPLAIAFSNARRYEELLEAKERLMEDNQAMNRELGDLAGTTLIGMDEGLRGVMSLVKQVAPLVSPVLVLGETGTGKELVAHSIHALSPRRDGPFVRVQCGAIPETLLDSELFGHERGAFTGAVATKRGRFERADGGTIFLDEIGELHPEAQVKLLRFLQEKEFERVGGTETHKVNVRVIAATHRNLGKMVETGKFREDLWFRLNVFPMTIPPLRERKDDIPTLVMYFISKKSRELNLTSSPVPTSELMMKLKDYDWPGNVRELQNVVERALIVSGDGPFFIPGFSGNPLSGNKGPDVADKLQDGSDFPTLEEVDKTHIRQAMQLSRGRIQGTGGAAELLGMQPNTLRAKMRKLKIPYGRNALKWEDS